MAPEVAFSGHLWTVRPALATLLGRPPVPPGERFRLELVDPVAGGIALTGELHGGDGARALVIVLHGLGGSSDSSYARRFAVAAVGAGLACLRLNLRGADLETPDFYHAGLTADLDAVLAAPALERFARVALVGFSLGGHMALRYVAERARSRAGAVVAVCPPLDLDRGATALDGPGSGLYRRWVLDGLREIAETTERLRPGAIAAPPERWRRAKSIREWDGLVVAPRWGFASAEDYYARASVAPLLGRIATPSWIVLSEHDPMVPPGTVRPALAAGVSSSTEVTWTPRGGHVGMPPRLDLGRSGPPGLEAQVLTWLSTTLG